jgi:ferric-chelate reductase
LVPLVPLFSSIIHQGSLTSISISIFYTRATSGVVKITKDYLLPGLSLAPGRPKVTKILDSVISRAVSLGSGAKDSAALSGVVVGVCGPVGLGDEVSKAIGQVDSGRRKAVGGVELQEESVALSFVALCVETDFTPALLPFYLLQSVQLVDY